MALLFDDSGPELIEFDADKFSKVIGCDVTLDDVKQVLYKITGASEHTYRGNLADFGYDELKDPVSITIYPKNFQSKQAILDTIDGYNDDMINSDQDNKFVTYNDLSGDMTTAALGIIAIITGIIIFFVSSVFVTSTILIGVIFGISTIQRRKEIGVIRALGARRRDVSRMFNIESTTIGVLSGIVGVGLSLLACFAINAVAKSDYDIAILPFGAAILLIVFSALLILIAGFVPAKIASRKDPAKAIKGI